MQFYDSARRAIFAAFRYASFVRGKDIYFVASNFEDLNGSINYFMHRIVIAGLLQQKSVIKAVETLSAKVLTRISYPKCKSTSRNLH